MYAVQVMKVASSHLDLCDNSEAGDGDVEEYNQEEKHSTFEENAHQEEEIIKVEEEHNPPNELVSDDQKKQEI